MSHESRPKIEDYLQFTPFASAVTPRPLIDVYTPPTVLAPALESLECTSPSIDCANLDLLLKRIQSRALETSGTLCIRPVPLHGNSVPNQGTELDTRLLLAVQAYESSRPRTNRTSIPAELAQAAAVSGFQPTLRTEGAEHCLLSSAKSVEHSDSKVGASLDVQTLALPEGLVGMLHKRNHPVSDGVAVPDTGKRQKHQHTNTPAELGHLSNHDQVLMVNRQTEQASAHEQAAEYIESIFEAEDDLEEDTSVVAGKQRSNLFKTDRVEKCLSVIALQRLLGALRKTGTTLPSLDKDMLVRLQHILLRSITPMHSGRLAKLDTSWAKVDGSNCILEDILSSLYSSLCLVSFAQTENLHDAVLSEEIMTYIVDNFKSVGEDVFIRLFSDAEQSTIHDITGYQKAMLDRILQAITLLQERLLQTIQESFINESISSRIVFATVGIVFAEASESASTLFSSSIVDGMKLAALSVVQSLFIKSSEQRQFILDEVLSNINKLPIARQGARQFKIAEGQSIQLVSALLLLLVQSSIQVDNTEEISAESHGVVAMVAKVVDNPDLQASEASTTIPTTAGGIPPQLHRYARNVSAATQTAMYIAGFLLERSIRTVKANSHTSAAAVIEDTPIKALINSFVEDFNSALHLPEWPAAELLLRVTVNSVLKLVDDVKQGAQVKIAAIDVLCTIACRIRSLTLAIFLPLPESAPTEISKQALSVAPNLEISTTTTAAQVSALQELGSTVVLYLSKLSTHDPLHQAATEYFVSNWIHVLLKSKDLVHNENPKLHSLLLESALAMATVTKQAKETSGKSPNQAIMSNEMIRRVYLQLISFFGLLQMFDATLPRLLAMLDHSQIGLRAKSLKCFGRLSEIDPSILSIRPVQAQISQRLTDSSPQVRDVAIDLLGKFLTANPRAGAEYYAVLRDRVMDTGLSVRKRVLKLCRDLYLSNEDTALRVDIASHFLYRLQDEEDSVQDLVHKTFERLWFPPPDSVLPDRFVLLAYKDQQRIRAQAEVISTLVAGNQELQMDLLRKLFTDISTKSPDTESHVQRTLVLLGQVFTEEIVDDHDELRRLRGLAALSILAQAVPSACSSNQLESLLPYLQQGASVFEQNAPYLVASIYRAVLPSQGSQNTSFLSNVQATILAQLTKLSLRTLNEIVPALCVVIHLLKDFTRVAKTLKSCLVRVLNLLVKQEVEDMGKSKQVVLLLHLIGLFGRYLQFNDLQLLQDTFSLQTREELINSLVSTAVKFHKDSSSMVSKAAIQSFGNIAITSPRIFQLADILNITDAIMNGTRLDMKRMLISIYDEYLSSEQKKTDQQTLLSGDQPRKKVLPKDKGRMTEDVDVGVLTGNTDQFATDGISPSLMQRYLKQILSACLGTDVQLAVSATHLIKSIVQQGLANPRNCVPTIIALETSEHGHLRHMASQMHQHLYEKHESLIESCYIEGVKTAYRYQMRMNNNRLVLAPDAASLETLYDIVKTSRKGRQKFLTIFTKGLDTNIDKIDSLMETDVKYVHFIAHNAACLEYSTTEEVHIVIHAIDKIMSASATALMQLLDVERMHTSQYQDFHGKAAAIFNYASCLRDQLKSVYNLTDAKCLAFEPRKLTARSDNKAAFRQVGFPLIAGWLKNGAESTTVQRVEHFLRRMTNDVYTPYSGLGVAEQSGDVT